MNKKIELLFVEDDKIDQLAFKRLVEFKNLPYNVKIEDSVNGALKALSKKKFNIIISDWHLGDETAFDLIDFIDDVPLIITTGCGDEDIAVKAMKNGAYDYLIKDTQRKYLTILPYTVEKALKKKQEAIEKVGKEKLVGALELAGAACHELNQPLTAISIYIEMLKETLSNKNFIVEELDKIDKQVDRMKNITKQLQNITEYKTMDYLGTRIIDIEKSAFVRKKP